MALPTSGTLTLQQIYAEFGAPAGTRLTQLVRGGAYVPNNATNAGVPTAPPITLRDFLGASNVPPVVINNHTITGYQTDEVNDSPPPPVIWTGASASYRLDPDGSAHGIWTTGAIAGDKNEISYAGEWAPGASGAEFDAFVTLVSGSLDAASDAITGVWVNLGTAREWEHDHFGPGSSTAVITVSIRPAGGGATLDTATITLTGARPS
jgi:hypothetical protein